MSPKMEKIKADSDCSLVKMSAGLRDRSWSRDTVWICGLEPLAKSVRCEHCDTTSSGGALGEES